MFSFGDYLFLVLVLLLPSVVLLRRCILFMLIVCLVLNWFGRLIGCVFACLIDSFGVVGLVQEVGLLLCVLLCCCAGSFFVWVLFC